MSIAKHFMMEDQEKLDAATEIAIRTGILERCEYHSDTVLGTDDTDFTEAYKLGNSLISKGDPLVAIFKGNRREMTDKIKEAIESHGEECPSCASYARS
jgi:hypothetical protein